MADETLPTDANHSSASAPSTQTDVKNEASAVGRVEVSSGNEEHTRSVGWTGSNRAGKIEQPARTVSFAVYSGLIVAFPASATVNRLSGLTSEAWSLGDTLILGLILVFLLFDYLSSLGWVALEARDHQTAQTLIRRSPYWLAAIDAFRVLFLTMFVALFRGSLFLESTAATSVEHEQSVLTIGCFALFLICGLFWSLALGPHDISGELRRVIEARLQRAIANIADENWAKKLSLQFLAVINIVFSVFMQVQQFAFFGVFPIVGFACLGVAFDIEVTKAAVTSDMLQWFPKLVGWVLAAQIVLKLFSLAAFALHDKAVGARRIE